MLSARLMIFLTLTLFISCVPTLAQRPGPQSWRPLNCDLLDPRTKLEELEAKYDTVLIKGFTRITPLEVRGIHVEAVELREMGTANRVKGIVVSLREAAEKPRESRATIDYDEIVPLLSALEAVSRVNESMTKLEGFEARYRTRGDLEVVAFRQTRSGTAATISAGVCDGVTAAISLDELTRFRAMIQEAKERLDEIK